MGLLEESRIDVSLLPPDALAVSAVRHGIRLDEAEARDEAGDSLAIALGDRTHEVVADAFDIAGRLSLWTRIDFTMETQQQTQWCWSATSVSLSHYYQPSSGWTQCEMANDVKGQTTCCSEGGSEPCNTPNGLVDPLERAGVFDRWQSGSVDYATIQAEVDANRPLAWRIGWSGGGGHFAVIEGYQRVGGQWVAVDDPWYGPSDVEVSSLTGGTYQGTGTWTDTYFTKSPLRLILPTIREVRITRRWWEQARVRERELVESGGTE